MIEDIAVYALLFVYIICLQFTNLKSMLLVTPRGPNVTSKSQMKKQDTSVSLELSLKEAYPWINDWNMSWKLIITTANSIIGVSILAMPFCFSKCGVLLAPLMIVACSLLVKLCCHLLVKSASLSHSPTWVDKITSRPT